MSALGRTSCRSEDFGGDGAAKERPVCLKYTRHAIAWLHGSDRAPACDVALATKRDFWPDSHYLGCMKLADYLFRTGMTTTQLRRALGLASRSAITRYLHGERVPNPTTLQKIIELTGGRVQLRDFLSPGNPECATVIVLPNGRKKLVFPWSTRESDLIAANDAENIRAIEQDNLSEPMRRAVSVMADRARRGPNGTWLLDGRPSDLRRIASEANKRLRQQGKPLIEYPGAEAHPIRP